VTISYAVWENERTIYEPLIAKFSAANPAIKIVLVPLEDIVSVPEQNVQDSPLATLRRLVSGADAGPALFMPPEALNSNLLLDLAPLMDADARFQRDDFYPGALEQYTVGNSTRVLPRYVTAQVLAYNKELFTLANLPAPKPDWTWNDLFGVAEQLAKKNGNTVATYGFLDQTGGFLPLVALLQAQGIDLLSTPARDVQLDRPEIVAAVERVRALGESGALFEPKSGRDGPGQDMQQIINDGKLGIWPLDMFQIVDGPAEAQPAPLRFATGTVPYPSLADSSFLSGGSDGYVISAGTEHPNEAWKWIEFLSHQDTDPAGFGGRDVGPSLSSRIPGRIPARKSLAEQIGYWQNIDAETAETYRWVIAHPAKQLQQTPDYIALSALSQALSQIINEKQNPQKALAEAQKQLLDQVAQVQLTPSPTPDTSPVLVATPEPQEAPAGATTVKFAVPGYGSSDMRRLARAFREQHPDIFIKIIATDTFTGPLELRDIARSNDCFTWFTAPQSEADFKALLDLRPLFDADSSFPQSDYPPALLTPYTNNGGIFGLPYAVNLRTLNYNRNLFSSAGISPPIDKWKPADFLAAAQALTKGEGNKKQYGYVPLGGPTQDLFFFVGQFGGQLLTGAGDDLRPNFDDPKVVAAIQWYLDLSKVHHVMPPVQFSYRRDVAPSNDPQGEDPYQLVLNGRAALWFDQGYGAFSGPKDGLADGPSQPNFEIGIAPLPIGGGGLRAGDFYVRGFQISAQSQQPQACWEFLKFLSSDINNLQGGLPARSSIATSDAFAKQAQPGMIEIYRAYRDALKRAGQPGVDPNTLYSEKLDLYWFFKALSDTLADGADLRNGLAEAQKTTTAYIECQLKGGKPPQCATEVDPNYQGYTVDEPKGEPGSAPAVPRG
jgi:ABC-type glycerol-3-phosphate transport system substrate-binding protein